MSKQALAISCLLLIGCKSSQQSSLRAVESQAPADAGGEGSWTKICIGGDLLEPTCGVSVRRVGNDLIAGGDIILGQAEAGAQLRGAYDTEITRWPGGRVPFIFDDNTSQDFRSRVVDGMRRWETAVNTGERKYIQFVEISRPQFEVEKFAMKVERLGSAAYGGSASNLGAATVNFLKLRETEPDLIRHELGHILGLDHEHQRPDRDDFLTVDLSQMLPDLRRQMEKLPASSTTTSGPFDFDSIMLYRSYAFAAGEKPVFVRKSDGSTIYGNTSISAGDVKAVRDIYSRASPNTPSITPTQPEKPADGSFPKNDKAKAGVALLAGSYVNGATAWTIKQLDALNYDADGSPMRCNAEGRCILSWAGKTFIVITSPTSFERYHPTNEVWYEFKRQ